MLKTLTKVLNRIFYYSTLQSHARPSQMFRLPVQDVKKLHEVKEFIHTNFESITSLSDLARHTGVNKLKLKHSFKLLFGTTAFHYLWMLKMEHAKVLLAKTTLSVKEIAKIAGYKSQSNFTAGFRRRFGKPPSAFKRR